MQRCPYCGKPNQPSSTFCLNCGEPIDEDSVREFAPAPILSLASQSSQATALSISPPWAVTRHVKSLFGRLSRVERIAEFATGAAILLGVLGFAVYLAMQQSAQTEHYQQGMQAEAAHAYERALTEYDADNGYRDTPQREAVIKNKLTSCATFYNAGLQARNSHRWWQAAVSFEKAAEIEPDYKDLPQQLADMRRVNGRIFYKQIAGQTSKTGGKQASGLFAAWADGSAPQALPQSSATSTLLAVSADGYWVAYTVEGDAALKQGSVLLYDLRDGVLYPLQVPQTSATPATAQFQGNLLVLGVETRLYAYTLPLLGTQATTLTPAPVSETPPANHPVLSLVMSAGSMTTTTRLAISIQGATGTVLMPLSTENGVVDGALFDNSGNHLLYRVCTYADANHNYDCSIKLVDLSAQLWYPYTIDSIPFRLSDRARFDLRAEFTRDGDHILLIETYLGETEEHLYEVSNGDTWGPPVEVSDRLARALSGGPLFERDVPGLALWSGKNTLAFPTGAETVSSGQVPTGTYMAQEHYVETTPSDMYLLYLSLGINNGTPSYNLFAAPFQARSATPNAAPRPLLNSLKAPESWLPSLYLLPEGTTLLSTQPPSATTLSGLYAYDLQTGNSTLVTAGVTDLYGPGYATK